MHFLRPAFLHAAFTHLQMPVCPWACVLAVFPKQLVTCVFPFNPALRLPISTSHILTRPEPTNVEVLLAFSWSLTLSSPSHTLPRLTWIQGTRKMCL